MGELQRISPALWASPSGATARNRRGRRRLVRRGLAPRWRWATRPTSSLTWVTGAGPSWARADPLAALAWRKPVGEPIPDCAASPGRCPRSRTRRGLGPPRRRLAPVARDRLEARSRAGRLAAASGRARRPSSTWPAACAGHRRAAAQAGSRQPGVTGRRPAGCRFAAACDVLAGSPTVAAAEPWAAALAAGVRGGDSSPMALTNREVAQRSASPRRRSRRRRAHPGQARRRPPGRDRGLGRGDSRRQHEGAEA